jgi:GDP-mannose transporter
MADEKKTDDYHIDTGDRRPVFHEPEKPFHPPQLQSNWKNHPMLPILSYCASSISMTVANKFVLLGSFNMNFLFLCLQVGYALVGYEDLLTRSEYRVRSCRAHGQIDGLYHLPQLQYR